MTYNDKDEEKKKEYYLQNKDKVKEYLLQRKEARKEYPRKWYLQHRDEKKEYQKKYALEHKEEIKKKNKKYNLEHKDENKKYRLQNKNRAKEIRLQHKDEIRVRVRAWSKNKYNKDPIYRRVNRMRAKCRLIIIKIIKHGDITEKNNIDCLKLFGTTVDGFKKHIENQFTDTMSWYNHGHIYNPDAWQLDHIIPIGSFDFTIEENFIKAFHYTNTQPLMSSDHLEKSSKEKGTT